MGKVRRVDLYPDEWLVGTATLGADERGCYITVCCLIYSYGEPVADDVSDLAKLCNVTPKKWRAIRETLLSKGKLRLTEDGRLTNGRCEVELEKSLNRTQNAREIGANGGKKSGEIRKNRASVSSENNDLDEPDASKKSKLTNNHQPYKELTKEADASLSADGADDPAQKTDAADPAEPADQTEPTDADLVWGRGLRWLAKSTGKKPNSLRGIVGRWCKGGREAVVLALMRECREHSPPIVDPVPWIETALANRSDANVRQAQQHRPAARSYGEDPAARRPGVLDGLAHRLDPGGAAAGGSARPTAGAGRVG